MGGLQVIVFARFREKSSLLDMFELEINQNVNLLGEPQLVDRAGEAAVRRAGVQAWGLGWR